MFLIMERENYEIEADSFGGKESSLIFFFNKSSKLEQFLQGSQKKRNECL